MEKVVLITGAASGMGKLTAVHLARHGYRVYAGLRGANGDELLREAEEANASVNTVALDVQDAASVKRAVAEIMRREGRLDVLVNNAGYGLLATVEDGTDDEMVRQFDVNVFGLMRATREVLPIMRAQRFGVIINISSFLGKMGLPLLAHYNASKYAVEGITDSLRFEVQPFNIRVHSIQSGLFGTNFVRKGLVANPATTSPDSPYAELVAHFVPIVAKAINEGPSPMPIAEAIKYVIENENAPIALPVGAEAETFIPMRKSLSDEDFEQKVKATFGL
ncbi:MAG: SDR family oxidoreductase [Thiotrichales bacterium]